MSQKPGGLAALPDSRGRGATSCTARQLPAEPGRQPEQALVLRERFASQLDRLQASPVYPALLDAVQDVAAITTLPMSNGEVLAICLRLHANGCTARQAHLISRVLMDDAEFVRGIKRFNTQMMPSDWVEVLRRLPKAGERYSADEVAEFRRLGFPPQAFATMGTENPAKPFGYVPPTDSDEGTDGQ